MNIKDVFILEEAVDDMNEGKSFYNLREIGEIRSANSCGMMRIKGDHHIFAKDGVEEILNLQPKGGKGKPCQIKQVRDVILKYHLRIGE